MISQGILMKQHNERTLLWACRRGMLELDLFLEPFCKHCYATLSAQKQEKFQQLLNCQDPDLNQWFTGISQPEDKGLQELIKEIKDYATATNRINSF